MNFSIELLLMMFLATDLMFVVTSRLMHCIKLAAVQGILMGALPMLAMSASSHGSEFILMTILNIVVKGIILPILLIRALRKTQVCREIEPFVGYSASLALFIVAMTVSFFATRKIVLPVEVLSPIALPVAFVTIFAGIFLIITRRKAITQAIGFLVFENGIGLFGMGMMIRHSFIVELGILLDVFVLIFVMGITLFHIRHEFHHIDTDKLNQLGDVDTENIGGTK